MNAKEFKNSTYQTVHVVSHGVSRVIVNIFPVSFKKKTFFLDTIFSFHFTETAICFGNNTIAIYRFIITLTPRNRLRPVHTFFVNREKTDKIEKNTKLIQH